MSGPVERLLPVKRPGAKATRKRREAIAVAELDRSDISVLDSLRDGALVKYGQCREMGLSPAIAWRSAVAWARNSNEQEDRRKAHGTGCV